MRTPHSENPLREPSLPHSSGPATPHAAHLWGCAPGSRGYTHAGCSAYKETNKVIEIETAPQASELGFLLKWLQGPRRGTTSASGPAHRASCSQFCLPPICSSASSSSPNLVFLKWLPFMSVTQDWLIFSTTVLRHEESPLLHSVIGSPMNPSILCCSTVTPGTACLCCLTDRGSLLRFTTVT